MTFPGTEFAVTPYGEKWLDAAADDQVVPAQFGPFAALLSRHEQLFGKAYHARSQEALGCYRAHAFLAACAMCGAAAEAILLCLAVAKTKDEKRVLKEYAGTTGRSRIERLVVRQQNAWIQRTLPIYTDLLKYWRDTASHGGPVTIGEEEAQTSLLLLLRFAGFASDHWQELT
jgi:hypothetical protein